MIKFIKNKCWETYCFLHNLLAGGTRVKDIHAFIRQRQSVIDKTPELNEMQTQAWLVGIKDEKERKRYMRGRTIDGNTKVNDMTRKKEEDTANMIYRRLEFIDRYKFSNGRLPKYFALEAQALYLMLYNYGGRLNVRYVKMPPEWTSLGFIAGVLEDLVVVLRTPTQIGLGEKHMYTFNELYDGFCKFVEGEQKEGIQPRFMFLANLVKKPKEEVKSILDTCYHSQGNSKRIGTYWSDPGIPPIEDYVYYYAIQGILDNVEFDDRVTHVLTPENIDRPYAVHFTKEELALAIWNKTETSSKKNRPNGLPIYPGHICKFERPIHALTNIELKDGKYRIFTVDKDIRKRMQHGIKADVARPKYQAGLVIDTKKLVSTLPPGSIRINEIGTLLVNADIPPDCILYCIHTSEDVETFWN